MIHIYILLCAFIAPFAHTHQNQQQSTHFVNNLLRTLSDRELILNESIKELSIKVKINGTDREFILQSLKGFFAGEDTKVWLATKERGKFTYTLQKDIMRQVNVTFYNDEKAKSTSHSVNKSKVSEFIRKRRDVKSFDSRKSHQKREADAGNVVYPEILVYVDKTLFEYFDFDIVNTVAYTLIILNGADLNFRQIENPEIRLNIAGIVLCQEQITRNYPFVAENDKLIKFSEFMYEQNQFQFQQDYDIAVLLGANSNSHDDSEGHAYKAGACSKNNYEKEIKSTVLILDDTKFSAIDIITHELSHLFGVPHDGAHAYFDLGGPGAENCPHDEGFIMSYERKDEKQFYFSQCSKEIMSFFFSQERAKCLFNNPATNRTDKQILRILPGKHMTIDQQCQKRGYLKAYTGNPDVCTNMRCLVTENSYSSTLEAALEGTACDLGKFCFRGECLEVKPEENDGNSGARILLPQDFKLLGFNKSAEQQCREAGVKNFDEALFKDCTIHCIINIIEKEQRIHQIAVADDGTLCKNNGYCKNGECVDQS